MCDCEWDLCPGDCVVNDGQTSVPSVQPVPGMDTLGQHSLGRRENPAALSCAASAGRIAIGPLVSPLPGRGGSSLDPPGPETRRARK